MSKGHFGARRAVAFSMLTLALVIVPARAQESTVDPQAMELLRGATAYLGGLEHFSVQTHNFREDMLESGQRVDFEYAGNVTVRRPNKLRGERQDVRPQILHYDGATVTLHSPRDGVYATNEAPGTIEEMFAFTQRTLGIHIPVTDLIWRDVFPLLVQDVTVALVIGKENIGGTTADHLLFSRPGVDFQIWIADSGPPLPVKYVVTDTGTPELLSIVTLLDDWKLDETVPDDFFTFVPPPGARRIPFMRLGEGQ